MLRIIEIIIAAIVIFWAIGFILHIMGQLIHIALIVAVCLIIYRILQGRKRV